MKGIDYADIILGAHYLQQIDETEVRRQSKDFIIHEEFNEEKAENNIALIRIEKDIPITGNDTNKNYLLYQISTFMRCSYIGKENYSFSATTVKIGAAFLFSIPIYHCPHKIMFRWLVIEV